MKSPLEKIPGVGPKLAKYFFEIGIKQVADFKHSNPEKLFFTLCAKQGKQVDRCVLHVLRLCKYFAENEKPEKEKLKWWKWKD